MSLNSLRESLASANAAIAILRDELRKRDSKHALNDLRLRNHHLCTIGLVADLSRTHKLSPCAERAVIECIAEAEEIGLPISLKRFADGQGICTLTEN